jgi:hypothetical protein
MGHEPRDSDCLVRVYPHTRAEIAEVISDLLGSNAPDELVDECVRAIRADEGLSRLRDEASARAGEIVGRVAAERAGVIAVHRDEIAERRSKSRGTDKR